MVPQAMLIIAEHADGCARSRPAPLIPAPDAHHNLARAARDDLRVAAMHALRSFLVIVACCARFRKRASRASDLAGSGGSRRGCLGISLE